MTTCEVCYSTYLPPDTGDRMPLATPEWDFVYWTPGRLETACFVHRTKACRDVLSAQLAQSRANTVRLRAVVDAARAVDEAFSRDAPMMLVDLEADAERKLEALRVALDALSHVAWLSQGERLSASDAERAMVCACCGCRRGEHPAPDEPGLGPATDCPGFQEAP